MLKVDSLVVKYNAADKEQALSGVSFSAIAGERVALIGANGAGKSTLLLSLVGILSITSGSVELDDVVLGKETLPEIRRRIGMVFQNPDDQLFMPTVYEDIAFGPRNYGVAEEEIDTRMNKTLESLGISHLKRRMAHKLSGGEKRLVTLAGVLVTEPRLLLMDEPSSFLDPRARRRLIEILSSLPQTMILATHDLDMALDLCERAVLLGEGSIRADGPAGEILRDSALLERFGLELPLSVKR